MRQCAATISLNADPQGVYHLRCRNTNGASATDTPRSRSLPIPPEFGRVTEMVSPSGCTWAACRVCAELRHFPALEVAPGRVRTACVSNPASTRPSPRGRRLLATCDYIRPKSARPIDGMSLWSQHRPAAGSDSNPTAQRVVCSPLSQPGWAGLFGHRRPTTRNEPAAGRAGRQAGRSSTGHPQAAQTRLRDDLCRRRLAHPLHGSNNAAWGDRACSGHPTRPVRCSSHQANRHRAQWQIDPKAKRRHNHG